MKRIIAVLLSVLLVLGSIASCSKTDKKEDKEEAIETSEVIEESVSSNAETSEDIEESSIRPEEAQVQNICQLATLQCYYHTVATAIKEAGSGFDHLGEKDTEFWVEYTATAELGVDFSKVVMVIENEVVYIYMPDAEILGNINVLSESTSNAISPEHNWYTNDVEITASDIADALADANEDVRDEIEKDSMLISTATSRAKDIIEKYVEQIAELSGKPYKVEFRPLSDYYNQPSNDNNNNNDDDVESNATGWIPG